MNNQINNHSLWTNTSLNGEILLQPIKNIFSWGEVSKGIEKTLKKSASFAVLLFGSPMWLLLAGTGLIIKSFHLSHLKYLEKQKYYHKIIETLIYSPDKEKPYFVSGIIKSTEKNISVGGSEMRIAEVNIGALWSSQKNPDSDAMYNLWSQAINRLQNEWNFSNRPESCTHCYESSVLCIDRFISRAHPPITLSLNWAVDPKQNPSFTLPAL